MKFALTVRHLTVVSTLLLGLSTGSSLSAQLLLAPEVQSPLVAEGIVNETFSYTVQANRNPTLINALGLPNGLTINTGTGVISGVPISTGTFNVTLTTINNNGSASTTLELIIRDRGPRYVSSRSVKGDEQKPFSYDILIDRNPNNVTVTNLLGGLIYTPGTGQITGTPVGAGSLDIGVVATNAFGTINETVALTIFDRRARVTSDNYIRIPRNLPYSFQVRAINEPTSIQASPLPAGFSLNSSTGEITGTPASVGITETTLSIQNGFGSADSTLTWDIIEPTPLLLTPTRVAARVDESFTYQAIALNGVTGVQEINLPAGLTLDAQTGLISGIPVQAGTFNPTIRITNEFGTTDVAFQFDIAPRTANVPAIMSTDTLVAEVGETMTYTIRTTGNPDTIETSDLPEGLILEGNTITGTPTRTERYYIGVYAANGEGTGYKILRLDVVPQETRAPFLTNRFPLRGSVGELFCGTITGSNSTFQFDAANLPPGLFIDRESGLISGTPIETADTEIPVTVTNKYGTTLDFVELIITSNPQSIFADDMDLGDGWRFSNWLGLFNENQYPWIFHTTLGWLYVSGKDQSDVWLYSPSGSGNLNLGWLWTNHDVFPYLFSTNSGNWFYYVPGSVDPVYLYDFSIDAYIER